MATRFGVCMRMWFVLECALGVMLGGAWQALAGNGSDEPLSSQLYDTACLAAVEVLVAGRQEGSGWIADPTGLVVTASHVVYHREGKIEAMSPYLGRCTVEVVASDRGHDIVLLRLPPRKDPYPHLELARRTPPPGRTVFFFGTVMFRHRLMIRGAMASVTPSFEFMGDQNLYILTNYISAPSPPGTSGGCWLDGTGKVIGNQSGFMGRNGVGLGIALATPPDAVRRLLSRRQTVEVATLGVCLEEIPSQPPGFIARFPEGIQGLVIVSCLEDGPAQGAGLERNQVVTLCDGVPVTSRDLFLTFIREKRPGDAVLLRVFSPDEPEPRDVAVTLGIL